MAHYDVIIAGAGPAGSTAARECAARGLSVLLLERAEFPRDKPCGGGVTVRAARLLPFALDPVVERAVFGLALSVRQERSLRCYAPEPLTFLTQRRRLDTFLAEQAATAGARLCERTEVRAVERSNGTVIVRADTVYTGRTLVVADGVNGRTSRLAGIAPRRRLVVALEGNLTPAGGVAPVWSDALGIDAGSPPGGYGWIFPKGDHLNFGVAARPDAARQLRADLDRLIRSYGFEPEGLWGLRGYHLPMRERGSALAAGNVLLAGDAAGLLDPFSLEGIYAAIWSGRAASEHIATYLAGEAPDLTGYARQVEDELQPDLEAARQILALSWRLGWQTWIHAARFVPGADGVLWRLIRGDQTYAGIKRRLGPLARVLDALAPPA
jgi:geranylgeranyl reductase family protein